MFMRSLSIGFGIALVAWLPATADDAPKLGQPADQDRVAAWDIAVGPDGTGLPPGGGSVEDGKAVYESQCLACHGEGGEDGPQDRLAGGVGSLITDKPVKTLGSYWPYASTVFDYVRRAMPLSAPMSLSDDEVYAVTAYLLHLNGIISANQVMNAETLPKVRMPNRDGFVLWHPPPK